MNGASLTIGEQIRTGTRAPFGAAALASLYLATLNLYTVYLRGLRTEGEGPPG